MDIENILPRGILVTQFIEDSNKMNDSELSETYGVSFRTLRRWKQKIRESEDDIAATAFPESPTPKYDKYLKLNYDRVLILGDMEIPDHDVEVLDMAVKLAEKLDIPHLILNGDIMAMDSFSSWPKQSQQFLNFDHDLDLARQTLKTLSNSFDTVDYLTGNHERRLTVHNRGEITLDRYIRDIIGVRYSNYTYCELTSGDKEILVCHPEEYSRVPLSVPLKICANRHTNVLCGHTHRLALGFDPSGKYWLCEGGFARSPERTAYKSFKVTSHPTWNSGIVIIYFGQPFLIHKDNFDFWYNHVTL